jgi:hypothetical protein
MPVPHLRSEPLRQLAELLGRNVAIPLARQAENSEDRLLAIRSRRSSLYLDR